MSSSLFKDLKIDMKLCLYFSGKRISFSLCILNRDVNMKLGSEHMSRKNYQARRDSNIYVSSQLQKVLKYNLSMK